MKKIYLFISTIEIRYIFRYCLMYFKMRQTVIIKSYTNFALNEEKLSAWIEFSLSFLANTLKMLPLSLSQF